MWQADSPPKTKPRLPSASHTASTSHLNNPRPGPLKRALSFQFLNRDEDSVNKETRAHIKLRYKDVAKHVIWPSCRFDKLQPEKHVPLQQKPPPDPRTVLFQAEMEDERSPYMPATINSVLRSDSEDSSDAEELNRITRL